MPDDYRRPQYERPKYIDVDNAVSKRIYPLSSRHGEPVLGILFPNGEAPNGTWMFPQRAGLTRGQNPPQMDLRRNPLRERQ